jgi:hypothetical protein
MSRNPFERVDDDGIPAACAAFSADVDDQHKPGAPEGERQLRQLVRRERRRDTRRPAAKGEQDRVFRPGSRKIGNPCSRFADDRPRGDLPERVVAASAEVDVGEPDGPEAEGRFREKPDDPIDEGLGGRSRRRRPDEERAPADLFRLARVNDRAQAFAVDAGKRSHLARGRGKDEPAGLAPRHHAGRGKTARIAGDRRGCRPAVGELRFVQITSRDPPSSLAPRRR